MKKNEQDILNIIAEKTRDIEVPEGLSPEKMEEKLKIKELEIQRKKKRRIRHIGGLAAACVVLVAGVFTYQYISRGIHDVAEESAAVEPSQSDTIPTAESYDEIYSYIEKMYDDMGFSDEGFSVYDMFGFGGATTEESAVESTSAASEMSMDTRSMAAGGDYSTTNVRQDGVDEADVAKTDGEYLYVLEDDGQTVSIVDTKDELKKVKSIELGDEYYIHEFYMLPEEKKVILVCSYYGNEAESDQEGVTYRGIYGNKTCVLTYDVKDVKKPEKTGEVWQSGSYDSSRMADGYVYLFSNYSGAGSLAKDKPETYIPIIDDEMMVVDDIYLPSLKKGYVYEVITSIDVNDPDKAKDSKAIFTEGGEVYVSNENIYYYETRWDDSYEAATTTVRKIAYKDGELTAVAQGEFDGYINDSFSIDEYEGYLRVVTTVDNAEVEKSGNESIATATTANSVYVLDEKLNITGKIEGLAEDERVYSARFMGATGYFVTFKETDPLFTVDLSNPKDPQIIGKLKIPGFSDYLHFYGEDKLLGIGMNVDEETLVTEGVKLSMFDISDRADVKEEATYIMENVYSMDVSYDYKAALVDVNKNIIGFTGYPEGRQKYYLFSYDEENGFTCNMEEDINGSASRSARGLYIGDTLYVVQGNVIESYSLVSFTKEDDLIL